MKKRGESTENSHCMLLSATVISGRSGKERTFAILNFWQDKDTGVSNDT